MPSEIVTINDGGSSRKRARYASDGFGLDYDGEASQYGLRNPWSKQAFLNGQFTPDRDEFAQRNKNARDSPNSIIPGGTNISTFNIMVGDLIWGWRSKMAHGIADAPPAGSVLNGINHEPYETSQDMEADIVLLGTAVIQRMIDDAYEAQEIPVAYQFAGSTTTINRSRQTLLPGDRVKWAIPHFDKRQGIVPNPEWFREIRLGNEQSGNVAAAAAGSDDGRLLLELQKYDPQDVGAGLRRLFYRMATALDSQARQSPSTRYAPNMLPLNQLFDKELASNKRLCLADTAAMAKLVDMEHSFLSFLRALMKRGIVEINTPERMLVKDLERELLKAVLEGTNPQRVTELRDEINAMNANYARTKTVVEQSLNMSFEIVDEARRARGLPSIEDAELYEFELASSKQDKLEQENALLWLSCRMGFVTSSRAYGAHMADQPNARWVEDAAHYYFNAYIPTVDAASQTKKAIYGADPVETQAGAHYGITSVHRQFERMILNAPEIAQGNLSLFLDEQQRNVFGTVLGRARPGEEIHIALTGTSKN